MTTLFTLNLIISLFLQSALSLHIDMRINPDRVVIGHNTEVTCIISGITPEPQNLDFSIIKSCVNTGETVVYTASNGLLHPYVNTGRYDVQITKTNDGAVIKLQIQRVHEWDCGTFTCKTSAGSEVSVRADLTILDNLGKKSRYCHCTAGTKSTVIELLPINPNPVTQGDTVTIQCKSSTALPADRVMTVRRMCRTGSGIRVDTISVGRNLLSPFHDTSRYNASSSGDVYSLQITDASIADCGNLFCQTTGADPIHSNDDILAISGRTCPCSVTVVKPVLDLPYLSFFTLMTSPPQLKDTVELRCRMNNLATSDTIAIRKTCKTGTQSAFETICIGRDVVGYYSKPPNKERYSVIFYRRHNEAELHLKIHSLNVADCGQFMCSSVGVTVLNSAIVQLYPPVIPYGARQPQCHNETDYLTTTTGPVVPPTEPDINCSPHLTCNNLLGCYTVEQMCDKMADCEDGTDELEGKCADKLRGLGAGGTAGVVVTVLIVALILVCFGFCFMRHRAAERKKLLHEAENVVVSTRHAYREELRRREQEDAERQENQIQFQSFGNPPSYEDVLASPEIFPQTSVTTLLDEGATDQPDTSMIVDTIIASSAADSPNNDPITDQIEAAETPEVIHSIVNTGNDTTPSNTRDSGPELQSNHNNANETETADLRHLSNDQPDIVRSANIASNDNIPPDGAGIGNVEVREARGSSLKQSTGKPRASGTVKFADRDEEIPEATPLLRNPNSLELSTPPESTPQNV